MFIVTIVGAANQWSKSRGVHVILRNRRHEKTYYFKELNDISAARPLTNRKPSTESREDHASLLLHWVAAPTIALHSGLTTVIGGTFAPLLVTTLRSRDQNNWF
jgi:hypothetical protein